MDAPFESPRILIQGAKESLQDLAAECSDWSKRCRHEIVRHFDPRTGQKVIKARLLDRIPPRLRMKASDALGNLRHALDQATGDAAILLGRDNAKGVYFPTAKNAAEIRAQASRVCKNVHPALIDFLLGRKAHHGGDDFLYRFCEIAGPAKHQRVLEPAPNTRGTTVSGAFFGVGELVIGTNEWNNLNNEVVLARVSSDFQGDFDAGFFVEIVLERQPSPLAGELLAVFDALTSKVESIVFDIEAEAYRLAAAP